MNPKEKHDRAIIEKAGQIAFEYEQKYFGCSQATVAGLVEAFGVGGPNILRAFTRLAVGLARREKICAALSTRHELWGHALPKLY